MHENSTNFVRNITNREGVGGNGVEILLLNSRELYVQQKHKASKINELRPPHSLRLVKIFINCVETERKCFKKVVEEGLKRSEKRWEMDTKSKLFTLDGAGLENKCEEEEKISPCLHDAWRNVFQLIFHPSNQSSGIN